MASNKAHFTLSGGSAGGFFSVLESSSDNRHHIYLSKSKVILQKNKRIQITVRPLKKRSVSEVRTAIEITALSKPHVNIVGSSEVSFGGVGAVKIKVFLSPLKIKHDIKASFSPSNGVMTVFNRGNDSSYLSVLGCKASKGSCRHTKNLGLIKPNEKKTYAVPKEYSFLKIEQEGYEDYQPITVKL